MTFLPKRLYNVRNVLQKRFTSFIHVVKVGILFVLQKLDIDRSPK